MTGRRLNVLRVVIGLNQGGVQQGVLNLFRGLDPERFHPIACAIENSGAIGKEIEAAGFEVITLGYNRQAWRTIRALKRLMRERRIDIVHGSSYHPGLYARMAGMFARVPVLINHEHVVFDNRRRQRELLNRMLAPFTDGYISVGGAVGDQVCSWYGYPRDKVRVIHNGVDTRRFHAPASRAEARRKLGLDPDRPVVGTICRLDPEKGHRFLFDAISNLREQHDVQWLVVGFGRGEEQIRQEARERSVENDVKFLGLRRDIPDLLRAFDIYVLPTLKEGFPNSVLEAMASGCAVVVSDFPGNLEVVTHGETGLVTPMRDSGALEAAIRSLLENPDQAVRLGQAARRHIEEGFSVERFVEGVSDYYETLWARRTGS